MAGAPAMSPAMGGAFSFSGEKISASSLNSYRVTAVAERLSSFFVSGQVNDPKEFFNLCLSLSRGIDYAVANSQVPDTIRTLPVLLKQISQHRSDIFLQAAIMVLMISVKNACTVGWFSEMETEELMTLANEIGSSFCSPGAIKYEENHHLPTISTIMARFYPLLKMGHVLASLEVKSGYGAYVTDFSISKQTTHSAREKIHLFVAQTDDLETSACITSPQLVNFLLNGKAVEKRTNVSMDPGPQLPTNVTPMLKYGSNLLQAVGQFDGHYIIVVAFMSTVSSPDTPILQDYVPPAVDSLHSDSDIIEGASRISLNCPISYKRIKTPVKGFSCKHLQCFDYSNYVDINSRRPSWRCPHCNQHVCYTDIRIDQNMATILKEVGDNVEDVIIFVDGSWKAVMETDGNVDQAHTLEKKQQEPSSASNGHSDVLDLTNDGDDEMADADIFRTEDVKPFHTNFSPQSATPSNNGVIQDLTAQVDDDFFSGLCLPHNANSLSTPPLTDGSAGPSNTPHNPLLNSEFGRSALAPGKVMGTPVTMSQLPNLQQRSRVSNFSIPSGTYIPPQNSLSRASTPNERPQHLSRSHPNSIQNNPLLARRLLSGESGPSKILNMTPYELKKLPTMAMISKELPLDLILDVLSKLPVKSVLRFRCICKDVCSKIDSPDFTKLHLHQSKPTQSLVLSNRSRSIFSVDLPSLDRAVKIKNPLKTLRSSHTPIALGSSNGLLCLLNSNTQNEIVIWNISTRTHHQLPQLHTNFFNSHKVSYGFGYDSVHDDYKLLRIVQLCRGTTEVMVYSLKSNSWNTLFLDFPYDLCEWRSTCVYTNSALHLLLRHCVIVAFDMATERFLEVPGPPPPRDGCRDYSEVLWGIDTHLGVVRTPPGKETIELWWLKHNESSWTKLTSISDPRLTYPHMLVPEAWLDNGNRLLLLLDEHRLLQYDLKTDKVKTLRINCLPPSFNSALYVHSIVKPFPVVRAVEKHQIKKKAGKRMPLRQIL